MVAPHQVGDLVRSYVRVPESGSEKSAKPTLCDLARASTYAATVSVPQNLPPATNVLNQSPAVQTSNNQQRKRTRSEETKDSSDSSSAPQAKVPHIETSLAAIPVKTVPVTLMAVRISNAEVQKLEEENEQLRKENEQLRKENEQLRKENEQLRKEMSN